MKPSYRKSGDNFLPVITHPDGKRETIFGDPLVNITTAKKYAQLTINDRLRARRTT